MQITNDREIEISPFVDRSCGAAKENERDDYQKKVKFAGPCAQGMLDPAIVPHPMSVGRPGLFVLFKDNAFLRASAHESVPLVGYLPDTCGFPLNVAPSPDASGLERNGVGPCWGRPGADLGPPWS